MDLSISCPGLPGCWSRGNTEEDALAHIREAIREYLKARDAAVKDKRCLENFDKFPITRENRHSRRKCEDQNMLTSTLNGQATLEPVPC